MSEQTSSHQGTPSFDAVVKSYERRKSDKIHALMPYKKGIAELRAKQASFRTIASLLKQSGVDVSHDTVARFCNRVLGRGKPRKSVPATHGTNGKPSAIAVLQTRREANTPISPPPPRSRGPRIADPRNV